MTREQAQEARELHDGQGMTYRALGEKYGVSYQAVYRKIHQLTASEEREYGKRCCCPELKEYMQRERLTWRELAQKTGVNPGTLYRGFCGYRGRVSLGTALRVAEKTGLELEALCRTERR